MTTARRAALRVGLLATTGAIAVALLVARTNLAAADELIVLGRRFTFAAPAWLYLLSALPWLLVVAPHMQLARLPAVLALALRAVAMGALVLALAGPSERTTAHRTSTVIVVDVSDSVDEAQLARSRDYVSRAAATHAADALSVVTFATTPRRVAARGSAIVRHTGESGTDVARALHLALGLFAPESHRQVILLSDGQETRGDLSQAAYTLSALGVALFTDATAREPPAEIAIRALAMPQSVRAGEPFSVRAHVYASAPARAAVRLARDGSPAEGTRDVALERGENEVSFRAIAPTPGSATFRLALTPADGADRLRKNNQLASTVRVHGPPRVLYVARVPAEAQAARGLLQRAGFVVTLRTPEEVPARPEALTDYAFCVLADVALDALSQPQARTLVRYVKNGGGLLRVGGALAFRESDAADGPLAAIMPVRPAPFLRRDEPSLALVLAIDKSGSMAGDKLARAREAALATAKLLGPNDYLGVLGFDTQAAWLARIASANPARIAHALATLGASGGTALFPALDAAYAELAGLSARIKHVVALTDGQTEEASLTELARSMRAEGITVSAIGVGDDVQRGLLDELAALGGGRAYFTRDPAKIPRLFTAEAELIAKSRLTEALVRVRQVQSADFLRGITLADAPPLRGYVETRPAPPPAEVILETERGAPLLARRRAGLGWSLAFTSDLTPRWAADWLHWPAIGPLFAQLVRAHMRRDEHDDLALILREEDDTLEVQADARDDRDRFVTGLTGTIRVSDHAMGGAAASALTQVAPGRYQAVLPLAGDGPYSLQVELEGADGPRRATAGFARGIGAEYRPLFGPNRALLRAVATPPNGGNLPDPTAVHTPRKGAATQRTQRAPLLLWLSVLAFVLDVTVRVLGRLAPATLVGA